MRIIVLILVVGLLVDCDCLLGKPKPETDEGGCGGYATYDTGYATYDDGAGVSDAGSSQGADGGSVCLLVDEAGACLCVSSCGPGETPCQVDLVTCAHSCCGPGLTCQHELGQCVPATEGGPELGPAADASAETFEPDAGEDADGLVPDLAR
jgi:hypothetical protein